MTIRNKLQISSIFYVLFAIGIGLILILQANYSDRAYKMMKSNYEIMRNVFDLSMLTNEYLNNPEEERPYAQWKIKHTGLGDLLSDRIVTSGRQSEILKRLENSYREAGDFFARLTESGKSGNQLTSDQAIRVQNTLRGMISIQLQSMVADASLLYQLAQSEVSENLKRTNIAIFLFALGMVAVMLFNLIMLNASVLVPLEELNEGVKKISAGDFEYTVPITGKDELGRLASSFNQMTENVKKAQGDLLAEIDERESAEKKLAFHAEELSRSNRDLEQFAYIASHDLQEPLRNATSCMQLLERRYKGKLGEDADQFIQYAIESAVRMKSLIDDLLTYSRVSTKEKKLAPIDFNEILQKATENLRMFVSDSKAAIYADSLPVIPADANLMTQVFQNLISNGIKFHNCGRTPEVHIRAVKNGTEWLFSITDNGIGIEPEFLDRIFVIFQRLHTRNEYPGTGLGLAIVKKIVENHGGRIWAESKPGAGSVFYFTIPATESKNGDSR